ncbi:switch-activating protein Sap1 [Borealophlyctis nickersoniae]|nr:switch-activating protein Sap1 [Borealophlyctis nickersoniae]
MKGTGVSETNPGAEGKPNLPSGPRPPSSDSDLRGETGAASNRDIAAGVLGSDPRSATSVEATKVISSASRRSSRSRHSRLSAAQSQSRIGTAQEVGDDDTVSASYGALSVTSDTQNMPTDIPLSHSERVALVHEHWHAALAAQARRDGARRELMTVNVGTLTGKTFSVDVYPTDTVAEVKSRIYEEEGIPVESQILVFRERALADDNGPIGAYGVQSGSTLQLVLHMAGGPGPPMKLKKAAKDDDSVVLLLCKQNEDLYMLELHMRDGESRKNAARQLYRLAGRRTDSELLREFGGDGQEWDLEDDGGAGVDGREGAAGLVAEDELLEGIEARRFARMRPDSSSSFMSTSTFLSLLAPSSSDSITSRPYSPLNNGSFSRPSSGDSAIDDLFRDAETLFGPDSPAAQSRLRTPGYPRTPRRRLRPATAISVMRLPGGGGPMIIIPKTRPASAVRPSEASRSVMDDTPPPTPPRRAASAAEMAGMTCDSEGPLAVMQSTTPPPAKSSSPTPRAPSRISVKGKSKRPASKKVRFDGGEESGSHRLESQPMASPTPMVNPTSTEHVLEFQTDGPASKSTRAGSRTRRNGDTSSGRNSFSSTSSGSGGGGASTPFRRRSITDRLPSPRKLKHPPTPGLPVAAAILATQQQRSRCTECKKKLGPATSFKCRCSQVFCSVHRYTDRHRCSYNYKEAGRASLVRDNPVIKKEKVAKI